MYFCDSQKDLGQSFGPQVISGFIKNLSFVLKNPNLANPISIVL
jgi:hypothetical protein